MLTQRMSSMLIFAWPKASEEEINTIKTLRAARQ
jgi:hypothetical protein